MLSQSVPCRHVHVYTFRTQPMHASAHGTLSEVHEICRTVACTRDCFLFQMTGVPEDEAEGGQPAPTNGRFTFGSAFSVKATPAVEDR